MDGCYGFSCQLCTTASVEQWAPNRWAPKLWLTIKPLAHQGISHPWSPLHNQSFFQTWTSIDLNLDLLDSQKQYWCVIQVGEGNSCGSGLRQQICSLDWAATCHNLCTARGTAGSSASGESDPDFTPEAIICGIAASVLLKVDKQATQCPSILQVIWVYGGCDSGIIMSDVDLHRSADTSKSHNWLWLHTDTERWGTRRSWEQTSHSGMFLFSGCSGSIVDSCVKWLWTS